MSAKFDLILQKQQRWDFLSSELDRATNMISRCYESASPDMAEVYEEEADELAAEMSEVEDWLIDHNAPGWVSH